MKKYLGWLIGIIVVLGLIIGEEVKHQMDLQIKIRNEQIEIAQSEEAKLIYEKELRQLDNRAFTSDGTIQSYELDLESLETNPMGGFSINLYINENKQYRYTLGLESTKDTKQLFSNGGAISSKLQELLGR